MKKNMFILVILLSRIFFLPGTAASEGVEVLLIRPDKFYSQVADKATIRRDPFSWSPEQINLYNRIKADKIDYFVDLTLQAILWDEKKPYAVINNQILAVGEKIKKVTIKRIGREGVVLEHDGILRTLVFKPLTAVKNKKKFLFSKTGDNTK